MLRFRKAILLVHGFAGGNWDYGDLSNELQLYLDFDVYTFTLPGHDKSVISGVTYEEWIDAACFQSCEMLDNVKLPVDLKTLSAGIFKDCTDLKNVTVGKKIETIGSNAFLGTAVTSFAIPTCLTKDAI